MEIPMRSLRYAVIFAWTLTFAALSGFAAEPPSADTAFALSAAAGGLAEVQAVQLAEKEGSGSVGETVRAADGKGSCSSKQ